MPAARDGPTESPGAGWVVAQRVIEVVDPDPAWPARFTAERDRLRAALAHAGVADEVVAIEHIGSTAVPGLAAKPVIDILIGLRAWPASSQAIAAMESLGYVHRGEAAVVARHYLQDGPPGQPRTRQIHAVEHGGRVWRDHLRFRDHLRTHPEDRDDYAALKRRLARTHRHDVMGYLEGKRPMIRQLLARAREADAEPLVSRVAREGFGTDPERYERARPGYPPAAIAWVAERAGLHERSRIADLGAGTGKLTRALRATGAHVLAVEPVTGMRAHLAERLPDVEVIEGTAEDLDVRPESLDALAAGQAFHWFDPEAALTEAHRVLVPGGRIALLWNEHDASVPWVDAWVRWSDRLRAAAPDRRQGLWRDTLARTELFSGPESAVFDNPHTVSRELLVERVGSTSFVAVLPEPEREAALEQFRALLDEHPETRRREGIVVPYRTEVHLLRKVP